MARPERFDLMLLILVRERFLDRARALALTAEKVALRKQGRIVPTCELALAFRYIDPDQAEAAARLYARIAYLRGRHRPLGLRLLEAGLITPTQLLQALDIQRLAGGRLGRILVQLGHLPAAQLEMFLSLQLAESRVEAA